MAEFCENRSKQTAPIKIWGLLTDSLSACKILIWAVLKKLISLLILSFLYLLKTGTAVAQWLKYCTTNRKVAGSIPDGVIGILH